MYKFILFFLILNFSCLSQSYSVKTVFKGDTVVILSSEKVDEINEVFTTQKKRIEDLKLKLSLLDNSIDSLNKEFEYRNKIIDSLNIALSEKKSKVDSVQDRLNMTEKWLLESSINSSYLYYSWPDSTIKRIDTGIFMFVGHRRSGNFSLVRMADNKYADEYMRKNWSEKQYPPLNWELNYNEKIRPIIYSYPFKINF
jgi:uncharacterized coiled-coil protein SlyX